jgi:hypothetical protein
MDKQERETLESLIDRYGLAHMVETLASVCAHRAAPLEFHWQDNTTAGRWRRAGRHLELVSRRREIQLNADLQPDR